MMMNFNKIIFSIIFLNSASLIADYGIVRYNKDDFDVSTESRKKINDIINILCPKEKKFGILTNFPSEKYLEGLAKAVKKGMRETTYEYVDGKNDPIQNVYDLTSVEEHIYNAYKPSRYLKYLGFSAFGLTFGYLWGSGKLAKLN